MSYSVTPGCDLHLLGEPTDGLPGFRPADREGLMGDAAPADSLWTVRQLSAWLSMTEHGVRCMLRRRHIPLEATVRIGRRVRFRPEAIRAWIQRSPTA